MVFICKTLSHLHPWSSLFETSPVVLKKKIFKLGKCISTIMLSFPPGKGHCPSLEQTWISFNQGCFVPSLTETGSVKEDFFNSKIVFSLFRFYLPLGKSLPFIWPNWILSPMDVLCRVQLKLAQWFWRRRFLNIVNVFFAILWLSPLGKGRGPLWTVTQGCFVPSLVKIGQSVSLFRNYLPTYMYLLILGEIWQIL